MAIRYSGDVEVRMGLLDRSRAASTYAVRVRWPHGAETFRTRVSTAPYKDSSTEAYDAVAYAVLMRLDSAKRLPLERKGKNIQIRRVFQAPCPIGMS